MFKKMCIVIFLHLNLIELSSIAQKLLNLELRPVIKVEQHIINTLQNTIYDVKAFNKDLILISQFSYKECFALILNDKDPYLIHLLHKSIANINENDSLIKLKSFVLLKFIRCMNLELSTKFKSSKNLFSSVHFNIVKLKYFFSYYICNIHSYDQLSDANLKFINFYNIMCNFNSNSNLLEIFSLSIIRIFEYNFESQMKISIQQVDPGKSYIEYFLHKKILDICEIVVKILFDTLITHYINLLPELVQFLDMFERLDILFHSGHDFNTIISKRSIYTLESFTDSILFYCVNIYDVFVLITRYLITLSSLNPKVFVNCKDLQCLDSNICMANTYIQFIINEISFMNQMCNFVAPKKIIFIAIQINEISDCINYVVESLYIKNMNLDKFFSKQNLKFIFIMEAGHDILLDEYSSDF